MSRYDIEKFQQVPDPNLICTICTCVLDKPVMSRCDHVFCSACITKWLDRNNSCPICRTVIFNDDVRPAIPLVRNMLNRLAMFCEYQQNGCDKIIKMEEFDSHVKECGFMMVKCRFKSCRKDVLKRDIKEHETDCYFKECTCNRCEITMPEKEIYGHDCIDALKMQIKGLRNTLKELKSDYDYSVQENTELKKKLGEERWNPFHQSFDSSSSSWESSSSINQNTTSVSDSDNCSLSTGSRASELTVASNSSLAQNTEEPRNVRSEDSLVSTAESSGSGKSIETSSNSAIFSLLRNLPDMPRSPEHSVSNWLMLSNDSQSSVINERSTSDEIDVVQNNIEVNFSNSKKRKLDSDHVDLVTKRTKDCTKLNVAINLSVSKCSGGQEQTNSDGDPSEVDAADAKQLFRSENNKYSYSFRTTTMNKVLSQSSDNHCVDATKSKRKRAKPCTVSSVSALPSYFQDEESDTSWTPGCEEQEDSEVSLSENDTAATDSSYEVQVPKPLTQIIDEMVEEEDSDKSWTP